MFKYALSNKAVEDLKDIWNYTYDFWSEKQADKYYGELINIFQRIAKKPSIGKNYKQIDSSIFGYSYKKHIVFYIILN